MKYDVGALPSATFGGWVARMCANSVVNFDFYNAEPCPEGCAGFMVAAIYTSSPRAAISVRTGQLQPMVPQTVSQPTLRKSGRVGHPLYGFVNEKRHEGRGTRLIGGYSQCISGD